MNEEMNKLLQQYFLSLNGRLGDNLTFECLDNLYGVLYKGSKWLILPTNIEDCFEKLEVASILAELFTEVKQ